MENQSRAWKMHWSNSRCSLPLILLKFSSRSVEDPGYVKVNMYESDDEAHEYGDNEEEFVQGASESGGSPSSWQM